MNEIQLVRLADPNYPASLNVHVHYEGERTERLLRPTLQQLCACHDNTGHQPSLRWLVQNIFQHYGYYQLRW